MMINNSENTLSLKLMLTILVLALMLISSLASAKNMIRAKNNGNTVSADMANIMCTVLVESVAKAANDAACDEVATLVCGDEAADMDAAAGGPEDPAGDAVAAMSFAVCETAVTKMCDIAFEYGENGANQMTNTNVRAQVVTKCAKSVYPPVCNAFTLGTQQQSCEPGYININTN